MLFLQAKGGAIRLFLFVSCKNGALCGSKEMKIALVPDRDILAFYYLSRV